MHIFFAPGTHTNMVTLDSGESNHCVRVLRLKAGEQVRLVNGSGGSFLATIIDPRPGACLLEIRRHLPVEAERKAWLHLAVAPTKSIDRFEWFLEKATECGVDEITPLLAEKSERRRIKTERLQKVLIAAMKQSGRSRLPKLNELTPLAQMLRSEFAGMRCIGHCAGGPKQAMHQLIAAGHPAQILVGPEGDFSEQEIGQALERGFRPLSFGPFRLRTETAALVACVSFNQLNGML